MSINQQYIERIGEYALYTCIRRWWWPAMYRHVRFFCFFSVSKQHLIGLSQDCTKLWPVYAKYQPRRSILNTLQLECTSFCHQAMNNITILYYWKKHAFWTTMRRLAPTPKSADSTFMAFMRSRTFLTTYSACLINVRFLLIMTRKYSSTIRLVRRLVSIFKLGWFWKTT